MMLIADFMTSHVSPYLAIAAQQVAALVVMLWITWMIVGRQRQ